MVFQPEVDGGVGQRLASREGLRVCMYARPLCGLRVHPLNPWNHGLWCFNPRWMEASVSV